MNSVAPHSSGTEVVTGDFDRAIGDPALFETTLLRDLDCTPFLSHRFQVLTDIPLVSRGSWSPAQVYEKKGIVAHPAHF